MKSPRSLSRRELAKRLAAVETKHAHGMAACCLCGELIKLGELAHKSHRAAHAECVVKELKR